MKKRAACLILVLCMLTGVLPCTGFALDYELTEKLLAQPTGSGYQIQSSVNVSGTGMGWPLDRFFRLVKDWDGAQFSLNGTGTYAARHYDMDTGVQVTGKNGDELFSMRLLNDNDRIVFASPLLGTQYWGFDKQGFLDALENTGIIGSGAAAVLRILPAVGSENADAALKDIFEEVGFWLSDYCEVQQADGITTLTYTVPGKAIVNETAWVLDQLRQNEDAALSLQSFISPEARELLFGGSGDIRNMKMNGTAVLIRTYDAAANLIRLDAELPFPEGVSADNVSLTVTPREDGDEYDILFSFREGEKEKITLQKTGNGWKGAYVRGEKAFAFTYALTVGATNYDRSIDQKTQDISAAVHILPVDGNDCHSMSVNCDLHMYSTSDKHSVLYVSGEVMIADMTNGSSAVFTYSGNGLKGTQALPIDGLNVTWLDRDPAGAENMRNMLDSALPADD